MLAETTPGPQQPRADGPDRDLELVSDLRIGLSFELVQQDCPTRFDRQGVERVGDIRLGELIPDVVGAPRVREIVDVVLGADGLATGPPQMIAVEVAHDAEQPRAQVGAWLEAGAGLEGAPVGLLDQVLRE